MNINRVAYELWVNDTEGVEFFDDTRLLADPSMQGYMSEAQAALTEQLNNEELNAKVAKANAVKARRRRPTSIFYRHGSFQHLHIL